jgi:hypothetical protein
VDGLQQKSVVISTKVRKSYNKTTNFIANKKVKQQFFDAGSFTTKAINYFDNNYKLLQ